MTDLKRLKQYCDQLCLGDCESLSVIRASELVTLLRISREPDLADYVSSLSVSELEDLLVNQVYGV